MSFVCPQFLIESHLDAKIMEFSPVQLLNRGCVQTFTTTHKVAIYFETTLFSILFFFKGKH